MQKTLIAGVIGIALIIFLLLVLYHFCGILSAIYIILYTFFVFGTFWLVGGVLTLPGIAALILGIGMAIDANVLLYERVKEELKKGKSLPLAFKMGSKSSFKTIVDSNLTTLLVAIIMFVFGESSVKGFATMLIINIAVTMVTMVAITRTLMKTFINTGYFNDKISFFLNVKEEKENKKAKKPLLDYSKYFAIFSSIIFLVGVIFTATKGLALGIDYQAGSDISLVTEKKLSSKELTKDLKELKLTKVEIERRDKEADLRVKDILKKDKVEEVKSYFENKYKANVDIELLKENLKKKGYKLTPQRRAILDLIIEKEGEHLTAEEIYDEVKKVCPDIGLATVYRTVLLLEEVGVIFKLDLNDGCSRYELVHEDEEHRHHHLICNKCKKVIEVQDDLLEELEERLQFYLLETITM